MFKEILLSVRFMLLTESFWETRKEEGIEEDVKIDKARQKAVQYSWLKIFFPPFP